MQNEQQDERQLKKQQTLAKVYLRVDQELKRAARKYPDHPSLEHSLCVIEEELDELRREVYLRGEWRRPHRIWEEAVQLACMSIRLLVEMEARENGNDATPTKPVKDFG